MKHGSWVRFKIPTNQPRQSATGRAEPVEVIPGSWYTIERSPTGWWLKPSDVAARAWASDHPDRLVSGCLEAAGHLIELHYH